MFDARGRTYTVKMLKQVSNHAVDIDVSGLASGTYFVRVKVEDGFKTISFIKD
ncbi:MAG: T9SS type A sorting domain-containing protein [Ferruginibacter sp.]